MSRVETNDAGDRVWRNDQGLPHRKDGPAIEAANGDRLWFVDGRPHRLDGPAIERANGEKQWFVDGNLHRLDGPAIEWVNGDREYRIEGLLHREDGPAIEYASGARQWYQKGVHHRHDGPADEWANGDRRWFVDGKRHRLDGPAVEFANGRVEYWLDGRFLYKNEFEHLTQPEILDLLKQGARLSAAAAKIAANPYYLGYAIDTGVQTPKEAFDRDGGNHGFTRWNGARWREQAAIVQAGDATTLFPTVEFAARIHHGIIARHLGQKLDLHLEREAAAQAGKETQMQTEKDENARETRFRDVFAAKPLSLTHDKARLIVRDAPFGGSFENLMTPQEVDWARKAFMTKDSPFDCFAAVIRGLAVGDRLYNNCTHCLAPDWSTFIHLEVGGCIDDPDDPGHTIGGQDDADAQFWTIYGRYADGDAEAITDCATLPDAIMVAHELAAISRLACESSGFDVIEPGDAAPQSIEEAKAWMDEHAWTDRPDVNPSP